MPLPTAQLDDRRFQDIVDQAKRLIPHYCPEWTDHNVSDPGVALIELFAWMTDMLLYRVNQVPEKMQIKFLELIGTVLEPPRAAVAPVTFYLSAAQPNPVKIAENTEVATLRTETSAAIVFSTETDLTVYPPRLIGVFTRHAARVRSGESWIRHDLRRLELPNQKLVMFSDSPAPDDAFYLALEGDLSHHVLAVLMGVETAGGAGIDPRNPPLEWQVWQGTLGRWVNCEVEADSTGGFNYSGEVLLHLPRMEKIAFQGLEAHWLRVRLTDHSGDFYKVSPDLERLSLESRGATVQSRHATTVLSESVGHSAGTPGERFTLHHTPLLARDPTRDRLIVETAGEAPEFWQEVTDFADSEEDSRHYTLDSGDGTLTLGPSLLQPDGQMYRFGKIPLRGSTLRFSRYQHGGGTLGNVPRASLSVLKSSIPYVAKVSNRTAASGGADAQSLEDAKLRAPKVLRTRSRAVTADDYEYLAMQVSGVARARCLAPEAQPSSVVPSSATPSSTPTGTSSTGAGALPKPGEVAVVILPKVDLPALPGRIPPEALVLSAQLSGAVGDYLSERKLLGSRLEVRAPRYVWVSVNARLRLAENLSLELSAEVRRWAEASLYRYLNPYTGGSRGEGWPFGRDLHIPELYGLLGQHSAIDFVEEIRVGIVEPGSSQPPRPAPNRLILAPDAVLLSEQHTVTLL